MMKKLASFILRNKAILLVLLSYTFFTAYYMGPSIWDCNNTVYGFGDNTAGPIWKEQIGQKEFFGGFEKFTNFPYGENTFSPAAVSFVGQAAIYKLTSSITNPICGYNLFNSIGFISSAIIMYLFIQWLTRNKWVALLAGYAFSFTPYFQIKVGGHPGYGYQGMIIASLWSFFALIKNPSRKKSLVFGLVTAIAFYFDPYFSLLTLTTLIPCGFVWLLMNIKKIINNNKKIIMTLKFLLLSVFIGIIGLSPLVFTRIKYSDQINSIVYESRGDIHQTAINCSNYPFEYLAPSPVHPLLDNIFGSQTVKIKSYLYSYANCGLGEDAVGIAYILIFVVLVGTVIAAWETLNKRKLYKKDHGISMPIGELLISISLLTIFAAILALPPAKIAFIPLPSELLIGATTMWRVISREYVVVNMGMVILFSLYVDYFAKKIKMKKITKIILFILITVSLLVQYQTTRPLTGSPNSFNYSYAPDAYEYIKNDMGVKALAEYPIEKTGILDGIGYYLTMQSIHEKPLINSILPNSPYEDIRATIKNLSDPITVPALNTLGVDAVVVHGVEPDIIDKIPYLEIVYVDNHQPFGHIPAVGENFNDILVVAKIINAPVVNSILTFKDLPPYNHELIKSSVDWTYDIKSGTSMSRRYLNDQVEKNQPERFCFSVKSSILNDKLYIVDEKGIIGEFSISQIPTQIVFKYIDLVKITTQSGKNVAMSRIGC